MPRLKLRGKPTTVLENGIMEISIVIVNWNTKELLERCLESVLSNLGVLDAEIIVVDNASSDGSVAMVRRLFPTVRIIENGVNQGFARANNQAIRVSVGQFVLLLNSDTIILRDVLSRSVQYMQDHPNVGVFGCRVLNPDGTMQATCFGFPSLGSLLWKVTGLFRLKWPRFLGREHMNHWLRDSERDVDVVTGCYFLVRRSAMDEVGLLDEDFFFCGEETDWCKRFKEANWRNRFAPVGEIIHIGNASGRKQGFRRDVLLSQGLIRYYRKHGGLIVSVVAWFLIVMFILFRVVAWGVVSVVVPKIECRERFQHFFNLLLGCKQIWPKPNLD